MRVCVRGMTMLETLVSLTLLSGVTIGLMSMTTGMVSSAALGSGELSRAASAELALDAVGRDLVSWDERLRPPTRGWVRVRADTSRLRIATRSVEGEAVETDYAIIGGALRRTTTGRSTPSNGHHDGAALPLLGRVSDLSITVSDDRSTLTVALRLEPDAIVERTYRVDPADLEVVE